MELHFTGCSAALLFCALGVTGQITVDPLSPISICGSPTLSIGYTVTTLFNAGNLFTVELSDASDSFAAPSSIGSVAGTGSGSVSCSFPAGITAGLGQAIRVVASDPAEIGEAYVLPITTVVPPNAGSNTLVTVCSNSPPFDLLSLLAGTPQPGGAWTGPLGSMNGVFDPSVDPPGPYTYFMPGTPPCAGASAVLVVTVNQAPVGAGLDDMATVCSNGTPFFMRDSLGGDSQPGGFWTGPNSIVGGIFNPQFNPSGVWTYTMSGTFPCADAIASLVVYVVPFQDAGGSNFVALCSNSEPVQLFDLLGGTPAGGGHWSAVDGSLHSGVFVPGTDTPGCYRYVLDANGVCPADSASVCITVAQAPDAGTSATDTVCVTDPPFVLADLLGGSPQLNGTWTISGYPHPGIFNPVVNGSGCLSYTVFGMSPCANAVSILCIVVDPCLTTGLVDANESLNDHLRMISGWNTDHPVIAFPQDHIGDMELGVMDAMGRVLSIRSVRSGDASVITLDLSTYSPGLYTVTLRERSQRHVLRILKN